MATLQSSETQNTEGFWLSGDFKYKDSETFLQDAVRAAALVKYTVVARQQSSLKIVPLTDLNPDMISAYLTCGAIGGTGPEFAAISNGYFKLGADGQTVAEYGPCDFTGMDTALDNPGFLTCGGIGTSAAFQAVAAGYFKVAFDAQAVEEIGPCDFSGISAPGDTPGSYLCGTNGAIIAAGWDAITDGAGTFPINGVNVVLAAMDFTDCLTFWDVAATITHHAAGRFVCTYDGNANVFQIVSPSTGETSTVAALSAGAAGTDITAAGYLNGTVAGAATAGTGGEGTHQSVPQIINAALAGKGYCSQSGDALVIVSRTAGETSSVSVLTAGTSGTDISGALLMNGLSGTGTPTAGTGGEALFESIVDILNAALHGEAFASFDGDAIIFTSPSKGLPASAITVLTAGVSGTDISGAAYLNGLTAVGTVTAATGEESTSIPIGIFVGEAITAADLVAGDVTDQAVAEYGDPATFDVDKLILENSLDIDDIVVGTGQSIRQHLTNIGLIASSTDEIFQSNPLT